MTEIIIEENVAKPLLRAAAAELSGVNKKSIPRLAPSLTSRRASHAGARQARAPTLSAVQWVEIVLDARQQLTPSIHTFAALMQSRQWFSWEGVLAPSGVSAGGLIP